jgi:L-amino acid N-acyltransferase YncA
MTQSVNVEVVTSGSAECWFRAISAADPEPEQLGRLQQLLAGGSLNPHLRLIIERDGIPFGRMAAQIKEGAVRFWLPSFRLGTSAEIRQKAMERLVDELLVLRLELKLNQLCVETRPGDDLPDNAFWLATLRTKGFAETAAYKVYVLHLDKPSEPRTVQPELRTVSVDRTRDDRIISLYKRVNVKTLERRDLQLDQPARYLESLAELGLGRNHSTWILATRSGHDVGYALANQARRDGFPGMGSWLLELGCVVEERRTGIASALVVEVAKRLRIAGCRWLFSTIDEINLPSVSLHTKLGFEALPGRHYVYRLS